MPDMIESLYAYMLREYPDANVTGIAFDETDEVWMMTVDGFQYIAPIGSDDDALYFYRPDVSGQDSNEENITVDLDDLY